MIKVVLLGQERGIYRWNETIRFLRDSPKIELMYFRRQPLINCLSVIKRIERALNIIRSVLKSDFVWLLPMSDKDLFFLLIARIAGKKVIVDYYSSREDVVIFNGSVNKSIVRSWSKLKYRIIDGFRVLVATKIMFLTQVEKDITKKRFPFFCEARGCVIPLVIPKIAPVLPESPATNRGGCLNIVWWGGISKLHRLDYMISEVNTLDESTNAKLWVFDNSSKRIALFKTTYSKLSLDRVVFRSDLTFDRGLWGWISQNADIILGIFGVTELARSVIPNKVIQGANFGKPIITRSSEAYGEEELSCKSLYLIEPTAGALARAIKKSTEPGYLVMCNSCLNKVTNKYSVAKFEQNLKKMLFR